MTGLHYRGVDWFIVNGLGLGVWGFVVGGGLGVDRSFYMLIKYWHYFLSADSSIFLMSGVSDYWILTANLWDSL